MRGVVNVQDVGFALSFLRVALLSTAILNAMPSFAVTTYTTIANGVTWTYTLENGEASLGSGEYYGASAIPYSTTGDLNIPSTLDGYPLTRIGAYAFFRKTGVNGFDLM